MRFLIIDTYYDVFLERFYAENPNWGQQMYEVKWRNLMDQCFGTADFYSANLQRLGHEATEIVANCRPLQLQWAAERGLELRYKVQTHYYPRLRSSLPRLGKDWFYPTLLAQVKWYRPDVIHFQDPANTDPDFVREIRPYVRAISAQIASPIPAKADLSPYDLMLSSLPNFVDSFRQQGMRSAQLNAGFEPHVLDCLKQVSAFDVVFVGGLSSSHKSRIQLLESVAAQTRLDWWGYGLENLKADSPLRKAFRGPAWALDMYEKLLSARITLNHHVDVAEGYANNMRLYEATGVGSLLVTDAKRNLPALFELGKEAAAYGDSAECVELIEYYLSHEEQRASTAYSGQQRTLRQHSYLTRMKEFLELIKPFL